MLEHFEGVRLGEDIEAVHDMRVWSRRLVAAMRVFRACFPDEGYRRLFQEARRVTQRLGGVRDLDVLIDHYERLREKAKPHELQGIAYLHALKRQERDQARKPMIQALSQLERSRFARRMRKYLRRQAEAYAVGLGPGPCEGARRASGGESASRPVLDCDASFRAAAPVLLAERYHVFYEFEPYVRRPEAETELHEMRIAAKWLRYTMELFAPAYADELKEPLASVKKMQELLGDLHDSDIRRQILQELLAAPLKRRGLKALGLTLPEPVQEGLGQLLAGEERERRGYYKAFLKEWKRLEERDFARAFLERIGRADA
jgi:CHAD domain-containing protein